MSAQGKVWFVTGSSSGFGRNIVEEVIARGERVVATARDPRTLEDLVARAPDRVLAVQLDVTKPEQVQESITAALKRFGAIDVLVNNAGYTLLGAVEETSDAELRAAFEPLFFGAVAMTRAVLPHMRERRTGTLVQLSSVSGLVPYPGAGAYSAAKHALEGLSESLAKEVAPFGVKVLIVDPGMFRTKLLGPSFRPMPELAAYAESLGPMRAWVAQSAGTQPGDPVKAAKAIVDAVDAGSPTLRLFLGSDAPAAVREKLAQVLDDVNRTEQVALSMGF
ncbi:SDR family NAD(P)-dependent oxidoreductase [Corallococcus exiguus]|uniref:oxidoreductase n=1 Tax=Corallococcus TaxID=83461 RepID=UPI000EA16588|nr:MULTISPECIES: oxidoreductase [Corallococcus]NNC21821.1 SDR family NAD(P)-dependent oxidoreductase [Corallococcus exiguus]NRD59253.1 SDR family NAD(P)-dependent oxidoreductase [Corallococcus exiguus]NRD67829.1 SDR family NAD(P)-dependent oxidoreductase [Corallococcus exiguus]RKH14615.1 SDR family NAD(P)-dependent oxidoreductase [Corallococcus sp. CA041A]RKI05724.1 SDR family NAD(P)-dependent oxidoreductase [Corallococcus sp. AB030]